MSRLLIALLALSVVACDDKVPEGAVATVDGHKVLQTTFDSYVARHGQGALEPGQRAELLDQAINVQVLAQQALRDKLDQDPQVAGDIELQRQMRLANAVLRKHLDANPITDEAIAAEYAERTAKLREPEYKARHILVPSEAEARAVIKLLDRGRSFAGLAKAQSIDPGSAKDGGDLGWFTKGTMVAPFAEATAALDEGRYTKEPVRTQFGYHVILLEDTRMREPPPLESVSEQLRGALQERAVEAYINGLRGAAKIVKREEPAAAPTTTATPAAAPASATG
jgi:peptidyl-prolyl cis-trans isomerase C